MVEREGSGNIHWTSDETAVSLGSGISVVSLESPYESESEVSDDMEPVGFAFGTVALVGPLASACLSAYGLLKDMKSIDDDANHFRLLVDTQMGLLSLWVKTWVHFDPLVGIDGNTSNCVSKNGRLRSGVCSSIGEDNCLLVVRILAKISKTLGDARALQTLYGIQLTPCPVQENLQIGESSRSGNKVQVLPAEKQVTPSGSIISSSQISTTISSSGAPPVRKKEENKVRSWFSRVSCLQLCSPRRSRKPSPQRRGVIITHTPDEKQKGKMPSSTISHVNTQIIDIENNPTALETLKAEIVDNLTKVRRFRWVLSDKDKGLLLAQELQHWNDNLFKILPLKRIETPPKIRIGRHYTMPQASPIFTGRAEALKTLEEIFFGKQTNPGQRRAVLHGLGGAGKTQMALKFAEQHLDKFDSIFWINASSDNTVEESFREIAEHLKVTGRFLTRAVQHRLASMYDYNYLLIFDNADNLPTLSTYLPGRTHGNILITSRDPRTRAILPEPKDRFMLEVDKMSHSDAYELLLKASALSPDEEAHPATQKTARLIVEKLGYLALAIDQAGAYIANTCSIHDYLALYDTIRPVLLNTHEVLGTGYAASVYQTWELSFKAVEKQNPAAAELLMVLGYFHYEGIPREIFEAGSLVFVRASCAVDNSANRGMSSLGRLLAECTRCDPTTKSNSLSNWNSHPFNQIMKLLCNYSLVKSSRPTITDGNSKESAAGPTYTIHPLIHCWIQDRGEPNSAHRQRAQSTAIALLQEAMLTDNKQGGYVLRNRLVSHVDAWLRSYLEIDTISNPKLLAGHSEEEHVALLEAVAMTYHDAGRLNDAEELRERVLKWRVENFGIADPDTIRARINFAMTCRRKGYVKKAVQLDEETLRLSLQSDTKGPEHEDTLEAMFNLAWSYGEAGKMSEAEQLERQVINARTKLFGPNSIQVAMARGNLGMTLWRLNRFKEAEEELEFALERKAAILGRSNTSTILTLGNLASTLRGLKRWKSAEALGREALELKIQNLGESHQDVARGIAHIGMIYLESGRAEEALDLQNNALELLRETVGDYHPFTLDTMENLAKAFIELGREAEAAETLEELVGYRKMVSGETHPATLNNMKMLGTLGGHEAVLDEVIQLEAKEAERRKSVDNAKDAGIDDGGNNSHVGEEKKIVENEIYKRRQQRRAELAAAGVNPDQEIDRWNVLLECLALGTVQA